jgi:site-specific DNA-methyltransferase (adenine-specific)
MIIERENEALLAQNKLLSSVEEAYNYIEKFDILETINNVGNDEIFTPVKLCNEILDVLPAEVWSNPKYKWLNPCDKNGVFSREIALRLDEGLKTAIPNQEARRRHIMKNMLFSLGLTKFTALVARRTLYYCSVANRKFTKEEEGYAIGNGTWFDDNEGNIKTPITEHSFDKKGRCIYCGTSKQGKYTDPKQIEHYAYEFLHNDNIEEHLQKRFFKGNKNMKFDIIIGNPPYQLSVGNKAGNKSKSKAIFQYFISKAIELGPTYLCMITPSRWMTKTAESISKEWVDNMLTANHFRVIHDFENSSDCFPGVDIKGGVSYFLYEKNFTGKCKYFFHYSNNKRVEIREDYLDPINSDIVVRDPKAYSFLKKIVAVEGKYFSVNANNFSGLVSPKDFYTNKQLLTSSWSGYNENQSKINYIKCYLNKSIHKIPYAWVDFDTIPKNKASIMLNKVFIPAAAGSGHDEQVLGNPFYGEPNSVCSQTYLVIGYDPKKHNLSKEECLNIITYIKTKFFRYLVSVKKKTQNGPRGVYAFVPIQDFNKPWTDKELYEKYKLSQEEIDYIEKHIKEMD